MMSHRILLLSTSVAVCFAGPAAAPLRGQFDEMVKLIPSDANALFMVNGEKLFSSEVAKSQDWQTQRAKRFDSGLTSIPSDATHVVIGSRLDLEVMRPTWDVAIVRFSTAPSLADVEQHFGGIEDTIGSTPMLRVADDAYVTRLSDQLLGAFGPGNRQLVAGWLEQKETALSPYLQQALRYEEAGTEVILAIDAKNVLSPSLVEQRLAAFKDPAISQAQLDTKQLAGVVSSLQGLMLGITFGERPYGKIKIDFGQDATALKSVAKPLVLGALANHGALLEEMEDWTPEVSGNTIMLGGYLGESGMLRIASLINLPTHALHAPAGGAPSAGETASSSGAQNSQPAADSQQSVVETTQQYFKSIDSLLRDLRSQKGEAHSMGQIGVWFMTYANRVDRLPILNVDEEMLQYGRYVAQQLRNCSMAIKGYGINKRVAEVNADSNAAPLGGALGESASAYYSSGAYGGYYGRPLGQRAAYGWSRTHTPAGTAYWAGRSEMRQAFAARTQVDSQLRAGMATSVQGILEQLREAHEKVRLDMTKKYQVEF